MSSEHERTLAALRESENRFRILATVSPVGIYQTDANGKVTYVNEKWCAITDLSAMESMGDGWRQALHPEDREEVEENWSELLRTEGIYKNEQRYQRKDGGSVFCLVQVLPVINENEEVVGFVGTVTDITERKHAEEILVEREAQLRQATSMAQMGYWVWDDINDCIISCSDEIPLIFGISKDEYLNSATSLESEARWIHPDDRQPYIDIHRAWQKKASTDGQNTLIFDFEYRIVRPGGEIRHVSELVEPTFNEEGRFVRSFGTVRDITDRKQMEDAVKRNQDRLKRQSEKIEFMQNLASIANESKTLRHGIEATLNRVCQYTGWELGHAYLPKGEDTSTLYPTGIWAFKTSDPHQFTRFMDRTQQGRLREGEGVFDTILKSGDPVLIADVSQNDRYSRKELAAACNLHGGFGLAIVAGERVVGVLEFYSTSVGLPSMEVQDSLVDIGIQLGRVAERTRMIERIEQVAHDAEQASLAKSNFLSTMSHEIRTPLNGVLGLAQLLTDTNLDQDQRKKVDTILSSGKTLLAILNDVLDMSRIEAGGIELEEAPFDLKKPCINHCYAVPKFDGRQRSEAECN
jgi:PAS domain S-box-containing protein